MSVVIDLKCKCPGMLRAKLQEPFVCPNCGRWEVLIERMDGMDVELVVLAESAVAAKLSHLQFYRKIRPGTRVRLVGDHPWAGAHGVFIKLEETPFGDRPLVQMVNGTRCYVMSPQQWEKCN